MKHADRKPRRAERTPDSEPPLVRCGNPGCSFKGSKFAVKQHRAVCSHG